MSFLTDVCSIQYGYPFDSALFNSNDGTPLVRIRDVVPGFSNTYTTEKCDECYYVENDDMLIGMDGEFNIAYWKGGHAYLNQRVCKIIPKEGVHKRYLFYQLMPILKRIENRTAFVTVKHLSAKELNKIELSLPDFPRQQRIADTLDKVSEGIEVCRRMLGELDLMVKAKFVEMFGDENYPHTELINLIKDGMGLSYGIVQPGDDGTGEMGVLRPVDMVGGKISMTSIKYIDRSIGDGFRKTELTGDELLITVRGTTGVTALTDARFTGMNVTRGIAVIRYDREKINPVYLNAYLNTDESQRYIQEHTRGATLQQINLSDLRIQDIVVPPINLQNRFAAFIAEVDKSKLTVQRIRDKMEMEKLALMQEYFK